LIAKIGKNFHFRIQLFLTLNDNTIRMTKQKNTDNKKLHSKLLAQKKNKKQTQKEINKARIREMNKKANEIPDSEI
jgi:CRISPR/Cas system-associated endonuclease Cas3-HD